MDTDRTATDVVSCTPERLVRAKHAYTTRHVDTSLARGLGTEGAPRSGDLLLARVTAIGQHAKIERTDGRRATLFPGDEVLVTYGSRYAPDQFLASVPPDLGPCNLVAAGGIAGHVEAAHGQMKPATGLEPVGLLLDASGRRLNLRHAAADPPAARPDGPRPVTVAVVGTAMNSGKTTAAAHLVRGLRLAGARVGAAKVTGTGAGGDVWLLSDAGAFPVYDFTRAGVPSTYRVGMSEVRRVFTDLTARLALDGCDVVVLEVADGIYQDETAALIQDPVFREGVDAVLFAACDAVGATAAVSWLADRRLEPVALTGVLSSSPLATAEAESATGRAVWGLRHLADPQEAGQLVAALRAGRRGSGDPQAVPVRPSAGEQPDTEVDLAVRSRTDEDAAAACAAAGSVDLSGAAPERVA